MQVSPQFEDDVKKWVLLDNKIKQANDAVKALKKEKESIGNKMITYIKNNGIEDQQINITGGKIKLAVSSTVAPMSREYIESRLAQYFKSASKAKEATDFIYSNREKHTKEYISRTKSKAGGGGEKK